MVDRTCKTTSTVALVDDHELVRQGIKQVLVHDRCVKVVGEAAIHAEHEWMLLPENRIWCYGWPESVVVGCLSTMRNTFSKCS